MLKAEVTTSQDSGHVRFRVVGTPDEMVNDYLYLVNALYFDFRDQDRTIAEYFKTELVNKLQPDSLIWHENLRKDAAPAMPEMP